MKMIIQFSYKVEKVESESKILCEIDCEIEPFVGKSLCFSTYVKDVELKEAAIIRAIQSCLDQLGFEEKIEICTLDEFRFKYKFDVDRVFHAGDAIVYLLSGDERVFGKNKYCKCCNCGGV